MYSHHSSHCLLEGSSAIVLFWLSSPKSESINFLLQVSDSILFLSHNSRLDLQRCHFYLRILFLLSFHSLPKEFLISGFFPLIAKPDGILKLLMHSVEQAFFQHTVVITPGDLFLQFLELRFESPSELSGLFILPLDYLVKVLL